MVSSSKVIGYIGGRSTTDTGVHQKILYFKVFFSSKCSKFTKKEQKLFFKELKEHFWRKSVLYQTIKTKERLQHSWNCVPAVAYHFCLALPAAFTQPGDHLLAKPCRWMWVDRKLCNCVETAKFFPSPPAPPRTTASNSLFLP